MWQELMPGLRMTLLLTVLTGVVYPGVVTGLCQLLFPVKANGSLLFRGGLPVGSALIGQGFAKAEYFHGRPSAAGADGYDATSSAGSNLGPTSRKLVERVRATLALQKQANPSHAGQWPADLVTTSASGLDPHISVSAAKLQIPRVAAQRSASFAQVAVIVDRFTEPRDFGFLGEPRVKVLELNLALDQELPLR